MNEFPDSPDAPDQSYYLKYMAQAAEAAGAEKVSPLVDDGLLPTPIQKAGGLSEGYVDDFENINVETYEDIELKFAQCEKCLNWFNPKLMRLVQTFKPYVVNATEADEDASIDVEKEMWVEPQLWCGSCIMATLQLNTDTEKATEFVDKEIKKIKLEDQKIKRIEDDGGLAIDKQALIEQRVKQRVISQADKNETDGVNNENVEEGGNND